MELRYKNGSLGVIQGPPGEDGVTPHIGDDGHWYLGDFDTGVSARGPKGEDGRAFSIAKVYPSTISMDGDHDNTDVDVGQFVMIDTNDVEDPDNAKLYVKTDTGFTYVTDLSGATGIQGPPGKSAYDIAVDNGFEGTEEEWLESLGANYTPIEGDIPLKPITKEAYANLSDNEKASETAWLITNDGNITPGTNNGTSSGTLSNVYSEEETVVGTYLGKPLYRKVFKVRTPSSAGENRPCIIDQSSVQASFPEETELAVDIRGMCIADSNQYYPIQWNGATQSGSFGVCAYNRALYWQFFPTSTTLATFGSKVAYLTIEYTKTTD